MNFRTERRPSAVAELIQRINSDVPGERKAAYESAGPVGAAAVLPLAGILVSTDKSAAHAARFALENIAHYAARPGASSEAHAVTVELLSIAMAANRPQPVRAEALHLLGFTGDRHVAGGLSRLLTDPDVQDEARMALERIPGGSSLEALKKARGSAIPAFRAALDQSIYNRSLTPQSAGKGTAR